MFTGQEDHKITFEEGAVMTKRYRDTNPDSKMGGFFSKKALNLLLSQEDFVGIRIYFALDSKNDMRMVMVGVIANENDQIGLYDSCMDLCIPCPDHCGNSNILNSNS